MTILLLLLFACALGMRHAFEPDHLAAISTLVSGRRTSRAAIALGAAWGLGHTVALLGVATVLSYTKTSLPPLVTVVFECAVGCLLIFLGCRAVLRALVRGPAASIELHFHGRSAHAHSVPQGPHAHVAGRVFALRSLLVGVVHGLAGSGTLTSLVAAELPTVGLRIAYVVVFGVGSIVGMAAVSGIAGTLLFRFGRSQVWRRRLDGATGAMALGVGTFWIAMQFSSL